ncbi:hypothetical protein [Streptomyces sp. NPDC058629]|uniref:hypothetical protein n=1 Tax=Streptomyces sp. NPDC058629 TaxID=3346565 RepID=UPI00365DC9C8
MVGRSEEVLDALPVAVRDRAAASRLPPWRAEEYAASRTLLRALLREIGKDLRVGPGVAHPSGRPYLPEARRRSEFAWIFTVQEACEGGRTGALRPPVERVGEPRPTGW